jgi:hypothetical protein
MLGEFSVDEFHIGVCRVQGQPVALNGFAQTILYSTKGHGVVITGLIRWPSQPFIIAGKPNAAYSGASPVCNGSDG